ncbi:MAG: CPBP family intramembrane metalloprotease, partial [Planctomycetota bacterium]|nr:CPBP family intramembrane metalloprotease [Planctomycetota bacterium]
TPLVGLYFSLPLFIVYHAGIWWLRSFSGLHWANAVDIAIGDALGRLGVAGPLVSFMLVIVVFLVAHRLSGLPARRPPFRTWILMILESLVWCLPVFMLSRLALKFGDYFAFSSALSLSGDGRIGISWQASLILSCGAGAYEEFFFRLLLMGLAIAVLDRIFRVKNFWKYVLAAMFQALLFAASHHLPNGPEEIANFSDAAASFPAFAFRTAAGLYFAFVYIERGFGIAAGSHAAYDLLVVLLDVFVPMG